MQIEFLTNRLKKDCEKGTCFKNKKDLNDKIQQRIRELEAADNLFFVKKIPQLRLHPLSGNRKCELAIDISWKTNPNRIVFETRDGESVYEDWHNDAKFGTITKIRIRSVWDYH